MNWYKKAQTKTTENIIFDIYSAITNMIEGSWTVLEDKRLMGNHKLQSYRIIHMDGKNIKMQGDYFWIEVKMFMYKALNILHPYDGTYENAQNWQQGEKSSLKELGQKQNKWPKEEEQRRWKALKELPPEDISTYDEQFGNRLIKFDVLVYGKKPDGKEAPVKVDKLEAFFGRGDIEKIDSISEVVDTPIEIAQYIKKTIDNYYGDNGGDDEYISPLPDDSIESVNYNPQLVNI